MGKVAVLINDTEQQYEGLRSSLGMLLYDTQVQMFAINKEIGNWDLTNFILEKNTAGSNRIL